jgi:hypothetical protein
MSLGGKTTTSIDPDLKRAALEQLEMTRRVGQLGFVPYKGATVAGFQPIQLAAMQNLNAGLDAFGFGGSPMPTGEDLSPYPIYQEQLAMMAPGQRDFINSMFIDPMTGAAPTMQFGTQAAANQAAANQAAAAAMAQRGDRDSGDRRPTPSGAGGGYNSLRDMIDGGGPGRSGKSFSGGGRVSAAANRAGISPVEGRGKNAGGPGRTSKYGK